MLCYFMIKTIFQFYFSSWRPSKRDRGLLWRLFLFMIPAWYLGHVSGHQLTPLKVSKTLPRTEKGKRDAMECFRVSPPIPKLSFFSNSRNSTSQRFIIPSCRERRNRDEPLSTSSPYSILGVEPNCSSLELKAAFRAKVWIQDSNLFAFPFFMCWLTLSFCERWNNTILM